MELYKYVFAILFHSARPHTKSRMSATFAAFASLPTVASQNLQNVSSSFLRVYSLVVMRQLVQQRRYRNAPIGVDALPTAVVLTLRDLCRDMEFDFAPPPPSLLTPTEATTTLAAGDHNHPSSQPHGRGRGHGHGLHSSQQQRTQLKLQPPSALPPAPAPAEAPVQSKMKFGASVGSPADKLVLNVRACINKVSGKNADAQTALLLALLQEAEVMDTTDAGAEQDTSPTLTRALKTLVDVSAANRFYAETFAEIVTNVASASTTNAVIVSDLVRDKFEEYRVSFESIRYVDADEDYDEFCAFNKRNETRRAQTLFFMHMERLQTKHKQVVDGGGVETAETGLMSRVLADLADTMTAWIEQENRRAEVEEIGENLSLLLNHGVRPDESTVLKLNSVAALKASAKPSLSSRVVFALQAALNKK